MGEMTRIFARDQMVDAIDIKMGTRGYPMQRCKATVSRKHELNWSLVAPVGHEENTDSIALGSFRRGGLRLAADIMPWLHDKFSPALHLVAKKWSQSLSKRSCTAGAANTALRNGIQPA
jgi:hypothetical protein